MQGHHACGFADQGEAVSNLKMSPIETTICRIMTDLGHVSQDLERWASINPEANHTLRTLTDGLDLISDMSWAAEALHGPCGKEWVREYWIAFLDRARDLGIPLR